MIFANENIPKRNKQLNINIVNLYTYRDNDNLVYKQERKRPIDTQ